MALGFNISGEFLTRHFRDLVLENRWMFALNGLHHSLDGITMDQVILVLKGDAKLCGTNDVSLEDDNDTEYKKELEWMYSGIHADVYGNYYKPYAHLRTVGFHDALYATNLLDGESFSLTKHGVKDFFSRRVKFYMLNPNKDIQVNTPVNAMKYFDLPAPRILLSECAPPPLWIKTHRSIDDAIVEFLENRSLPEVGASTEKANIFQSDVDTAENAVILPHDFDNEFKTQVNKDKDKEDVNFRIDIERQKQEQVEFEKQIDRLRAEIIETANSYIYGDKGWFLLDLKDGRSIKIPRPPFEQWTFSRISVRNIAIPWEPISPSGMKLYNDDPYHTDWILGAGLDLNVMMNEYSHPDVYDKEIHDAAWEKRFDLVRERLNFDFLPLCGDKDFDDLCFVPDLTKDNPLDGLFNQKIIILENLDAKHFSLYQKIPDGACILAGSGGPGSHMVIANKKDICIGVVENIHLIATNSTQILISFKTGAMHINDMPALKI